MRLVLVSSHYPPNWVSGGSLVPHRAAVALAERGHEVHVFAGAVDPDRPDGDTWEDVGEAGVPVHWTAITGWTDWSHPFNYDNPRVMVSFLRYLERIAPEVVHAHSLQGFGGGLVTAARSLGIPTVVTMHDFWWFCGRQFLVDADLHPCSLVAKAGVCPCEVGAVWRERRETALAAHLQMADLVLAPSGSLAEALVANGVDPHRIRVDENGMPGAERLAHSWRAPTTRADGTVRFLYAGGAHPLKGCTVLIEAATRLASVPGWSLDMYGFADDHDLSVPSHLPIRLHRGYPAERTMEVMHDHDVLVLPSLARESYSLTCREALSAGLPVVTSDTPGPMEVIRDRENGLVVPAGDVEALAGALRSIVEDEALRKELTPAPGSCPLRSVGEQVDALEVIYEELRTRPRELPQPAAGDLRHVLFVVGIEGAPLRYRARLPEEALALRGVRAEVRYYRSDDVPELASGADAVILYRVPATVQILELIESLHARPDPVPVLFDIDDLVFDPELHHEIDPLLKHLPQIDRDRYWEGVRRYRTSLEHCDAYIGSTEALCAAAGEVAGIPTHRFANGVGIQLARVSDLALRRPRRPGALRIGYFSGTSTHNDDWAAIEPAVLDVLRRHPDVELWLGGLLEPGPGVRELGRRVVRLPMKPWYELPSLLRDVDINLAPLTLGGRFNDAKSAIKWLEAALVGTPTIATPTEPFVEAIEDRVTGLLATTPSDWADQLTWLLEDHAARHRIGQNARRAALLRWSPDRQADRYLEILRSARAMVRDGGHRTPSAGWASVLLDEPYLAFALERYELPPDFLAGRRSLSRVAADYLSRGRDHLAHHGAAATLRKASTVIAKSPRRVASRLSGRAPLS